MSADEFPQWQHHDGDRYQAIACSVWMNETGSGFWYRTMGQEGSFGAAVSRGFTEAGSDDFNLGVIRGGRLVALLWMLDVVDDEPEVLARVAEQTGHRT